ncbi:MAG: universal stress protein [Flavobacteriales bacterium]|nr:universal stress protein [Flavobacteriales bacterium]MCB9204043.1 universal stress protein [Flavobacteriales bacterium]
MKKILVPTDRSENAKHALNYALNLFSGEEIEFILFQSFDVPTYTADMPMPIDVIGAEELNRILAEDAETLKEEYKNSNFSFSTVVEHGSLTLNIEDLVEKLGIDLVVMGTKGASGLAAAIIGSNTSDVIQAATCSVLAVPESADVSALPKQILFASDNKGLSDSEVIAPLVFLAKKFNSHIHLMNVLDEGKMTSVDEAVAGLNLDHLLEEVEHTFHFENSNDKAHAIEEYLNTHNIDMLAVIPRKNNFFDAIFHRSVTRKLTLHTKVPLLAMHDLG